MGGAYFVDISCGGKLMFAFEFVSSFFLFLISRIGHMSMHYSVYSIPVHTCRLAVYGEGSTSMIALTNVWSVEALDVVQLQCIVY